MTDGPKAAGQRPALFVRRSMSFTPSGHRPGDRRQPKPHRLRCEECGTEHNLAIRAITALAAGDGDLVTVSYTCMDCLRFHEHTAYMGDVTAALRQVLWTPDLLIFGDEYIHCGRPMEPTGHEFQALHYWFSNGPSPGRLRRVLLPIQILGCRCGFRLEIPE